MKTGTLLLASLLLSAGCAKSDSPEAAGQEARAERMSPAPLAEADQGPAKDERSQYDLADAIREAELVQDVDDRALSFARLVDAWKGKRYRWSVMFVHAFCPDAERCNVVPFDRGGKDRHIVQGWSPQLQLSSEQWPKIPEGCPGDAARCTLTFEGTLSTFRLSTEELTKLSFDEVEVVSVQVDPA